MTTFLIVNSDDYGRSAGISQGIRQAHTHGIVTSTTCMMNFPTTMDDIALALQETPQLGMGVHLVLTSGYPLLSAAQVPSLVTAAGAFMKLDQFITNLNKVDPAEAKVEWHTQIESFIRAAGRKPTHLDSHHHASYYTEGLFRAMLELAQEYDCAIRLVTAQGSSDDLIGLPGMIQENIHEYAPRLLKEFAPPTPDAFYASFYDQQATKDEILHILHNLPENGVHEIMCHPGYVDAGLIASTIYARQRAVELAVLTDDAVQQAIKTRGIQLTTFASLHP